MLFSIVLLLVLASGGLTYFKYRDRGPRGGLVPAMLTILLVVVLVGMGLR